MTKKTIKKIDSIAEKIDPIAQLCIEQMRLLKGVHDYLNSQAQILENLIQSNKLLQAKYATFEAEMRQKLEALSDKTSVPTDNRSAE